MHKTGNKGDIGVDFVTADLLEKGFEVLWPASSTSPFDLVVLSASIFWRVQVKYVSEKHGAIEVCARRRIVSNRRIVARRLTPEEFDVLAVFCPQTRTCYYIGANCPYITLRVTFPANGIRKTIHLASEYRCFPPIAGSRSSVSSVS